MANSTPSTALSNEGPTAERILDAAEALFAEKGFAGTAVRDIASAVDLTPASLYNHFANKQALYEAVLERGIRPLIAQLESVAREGGSVETVEQLVAQLRRTPHLPRLIHHEAVTGGEHLVRVARGFIQPLYNQALLALQRNPNGAWETAELPLLIELFLNVIFGRFAMASLLGEVVGEDLLSEANLDRHTEFLRKVIARLLDREREAPDEGG